MMWKKVVAILTVICGLAILSDSLFAAQSEYRFSRAVREATGLSSDPEVTIRGFPFLWHSNLGNYDEITIRAKEMPLGSGRFAEMEATLTQVSSPQHGVTLHGDDQLYVQSARARTQLDARNLGRYLGIPDLRISSRTARTQEAPYSYPSLKRTLTTYGVVLEGTVRLGDGFASRVAVRATLWLENNSIRIVPVRPYTGLEAPNAVSAPPGTETDVLNLFNVTLPPIPLPFDMTPERIRVHGSKIIIEGSTTGMNITPLRFYFV